MKLTRYVFLSGASGDVSVESANRLFRQGWRAVRELPIPHGGIHEGGQASTQHGVLVLLEKETDFPAFPHAMLDGTIPVESLRDVALFEGLSLEEIREILSLAEVVQYDEGQVLFRAGDSADSLSLILSGSIVVTMPNLPIEHTEIVELGTGEVLGESTFFSPAPHTVTAEASARSSLLTVKRPAYEELLQGQRSSALKLALNAARLLASRLQETDGWIHDLLLEQQDQQIASSWRRFRAGISRTTPMSGGLFRIGFGT